MRKLHIGCGRKILKGYVNLDSVKLSGVDVVHNLDIFPYPFKDNTFDEILGEHILEHVDDLIKTLEELWRIMKPNGILRVTVPYYNTQAAFQDPTHKRFFALTTFDYFKPDSPYGYYAKCVWDIVKREPTPTSFGKLIPKFMRDKASIVLGEVYASVYFELRAVKGRSTYKEKPT